MFVESKPCKDCIKELNPKVDRDRLKVFIEHRLKCRKCIGCDRLLKAREYLEE